MTSQRKEIEISRDRHPSRAAEAENSRACLPRTDVIEGQDSLVLLLDMPGVAEKSLNINLEKDTLSITGQIETIHSGQHELEYRECEAGWYRRSFALADWFDGDKVEAEYRDGVLKVVLPKHEKVKPRKITVRAS